MKRKNPQYRPEDVATIASELRELDADHESKRPPCDLSIKELLAHSVCEGATVEGLNFEIEILAHAIDEMLDRVDPDGPTHKAFGLLRHKIGALSVIVYRLTLLAKDPEEMQRDQTISYDAEEGGATCDAE